MRTPIRSLRQFRSRAEAAFLRENPGARAGAWTHGPTRVTWADGSTGFSGSFRGTGKGYRARTILATSHDGDLWIR